MHGEGQSCTGRLAAACAHACCIQHPHTLQDNHGCLRACLQAEPRAEAHYLEEPGGDAACAEEELGHSMMKQHRYSEAEHYFRQASEIYASSSGSFRSFSNLHCLAIALVLQDKHAEAEPIARAALAGLEGLGYAPDHIAMISTRLALGEALMYGPEHRHAEALTEALAGLSGCDMAQSGQGDPTMTDSLLTIIGHCYGYLGQPRAAVPIFRRLVEQREQRAVHGPSHPKTTAARKWLSMSLEFQGECWVLLPQH